jgi:hypothetical protein
MHGATVKIMAVLIKRDNYVVSRYLVVPRLQNSKIWANLYTKRNLNGKIKLGGAGKYAKFREEKV